MKREIKNIFIELGKMGVSPITAYNILKDFIFFSKEDFEEINRVFRARMDVGEVFLFYKYINETFNYINYCEISDLSVIHIQEIPAWEDLVDSLDSREE